MKKKEFSDPELIIDRFEEDIICYSGGSLIGGEGDHDEDGDDT